MRNSPGPDIAFGSTCRSDKEGPRKRWKQTNQSVQNHKQLIIWSRNRTEGLSVGAVCSNFSWARAVPYCQSTQFMLDSGLRVFFLMILQPPRVCGAWGELVYKGVFVQESLFSAKRWWQKLLLIVAVWVKIGGCCASKSPLLCSSSKSSRLDETRVKC